MATNKQMNDEVAWLKNPKNSQNFAKLDEQDEPTTPDILATEKNLKANQAYDKQRAINDGVKSSIGKVNKSFTELENLTDEQWQSQTTLAAIVYGMPELAVGGKSLSQIYETVQKRKQVKAELRKYGDVKDIPDNIVKQANEVGLDVENETNPWLRVLGFLGGAASKMGDMHVKAMEAAGEAQPDSIYGGVGQMAKNRREQEKIAREQAEKERAFGLQQQGLDETSRHNKAIEELQGEENALQKDAFDLTKWRSGVDYRLQIAGSVSKVMSDVLSDDELRMSFLKKDGTVDYDKLTAHASNVMGASGINNELLDMIKYKTGAGDLLQLNKDGQNILINNKGDIVNPESALDTLNLKMFNLSNDIANTSDPAIKNKLLLDRKKLEKKIKEQEKLNMRYERINKRLEERDKLKAMPLKEYLKFTAKEGISEVAAVFDLLDRGNYAVANVALNAIDKNEFDPIKAAYDGLTGEQKTQFYDVLSESGWNPTSSAGKMSKAITGVALDVGLDPTNLLLIGVLAKAKKAEKVVDIAKNADDVAVEGLKLLTGRNIKLLPSGELKMAGDVVEATASSIPSQKLLGGKIIKLLGSAEPKMAEGVIELGASSVAKKPGILSNIGSKLSLKPAASKTAKVATNKAADFSKYAKDVEIWKKNSNWTKTSKEFQDMMSGYMYPPKNISKTQKQFNEWLKAAIK